MTDGLYNLWEFPDWCFALDGNEYCKCLDECLSDGFNGCLSVSCRLEYLSWYDHMNVLVQDEIAEMVEEY